MGRYFGFNFVYFDLHRVIARRNPFTEDHIQQIVYSTLRGLKVQSLRIQVFDHAEWFLRLVYSLSQHYSSRKSEINGRCLRM